MSGTVLLVGLGNLGGPLLDRLAVEPAVDRLIACGRSARRGAERVNLARLGALVAGRQADITFHSVDLRRHGALRDVLASTRPDVVINTASLQTWWLLEVLPEAPATRLKAAGFGAWLPLHLALSLDFMREIEAAAFTGSVLTGSFPDVVNCVLGRCGRAPTCGIGNLDEIVPKLQILAGDRLGARAAEIDVTLVAHHALEAAAFTAEGAAAEETEVPPFFVRLEHRGEDVTDVVDAAALVLEAFPLPTGPAWGSLGATSAVRLVRALLGSENERLHAPGPEGLPGGYPVLVSNGTVRIADISGLSRDKAVAINEASHRFDGIDQIEEDGSVTLGEVSRGILREELGVDGGTLRPDDVADRAAELAAKFEEYARGYGVNLERLTGKGS